MKKFTAFLIFLLLIPTFLSIVFYVKTGVFFPQKRQISSIIEWEKYEPNQSLKGSAQAFADSILLLCNDTLKAEEVTMVYMIAENAVKEQKSSELLLILSKHDPFKKDDQSLNWFDKKLYDYTCHYEDRSVFKMWKELFGIKTDESNIAEPEKRFDDFIKLFLSDTTLSHDAVSSISNRGGYYLLSDFRQYMSTDTTQFSDATNKYFRELLAVPSHSVRIGIQLRNLDHRYSAYREVYGITAPQ